MGYPKGPRPETMALAKKIAKSAGKRGKNIVQLMKSLRLEAPSIRRAIIVAHEKGLIRKEGATKNRMYYATE